MTSPRFQVVPAAYIFLRRGGEVLLQLRTNTGYMDGHWAAAAAGHVEAGESVYQAAVREAREELDITIRAADLIPLTSLHRRGSSDQPIEQRVDWMFTAEIWEGEPRRAEEEKNSALQWYSLDDLPLMPPHERYVLERWQAGKLRSVEVLGF